MIKLNVEPYCQQGCRMFNPKCVIQHYDPSNTMTLVECTWKGQCRYLHNYLKAKEETDDKN